MSIIYIYICIYIHTCVYIYIYTSVYIYIYVYVYVYIYMYTYIYIHIYTYTYTYIHTYIYVYIYIYTHSYVKESYRIHTVICPGGMVCFSKKNQANNTMNHTPFAVMNLQSGHHSVPRLPQVILQKGVPQCFVLKKMIKALWMILTFLDNQTNIFGWSTNWPLKTMPNRVGILVEIHVDFWWKLLDSLRKIHGDCAWEIRSCECNPYEIRCPFHSLHSDLRIIPIMWGKKTHNVDLNVFCISCFALSLSGLIIVKIYITSIYKNPSERTSRKRMTVA